MFPALCPLHGRPVRADIPGLCEHLLSSMMAIREGVRMSGLDRECRVLDLPLPTAKGFAFKALQPIVCPLGDYSMHAGIFL